VVVFGARLACGDESRLEEEEEDEEEGLGIVCVSMTTIRGRSIHKRRGPVFVMCVVVVVVVVSVGRK
jgi:hypothetical protein